MILFEISPVSEKSYVTSELTMTFAMSVCRNASYRTVVLEMFPNIKVLDGEIHSLFLKSPV